MATGVVQVECQEAVERRNIIMTKIIIIIGRDRNKIPRVWGAGPTWDIAETRCHTAAVDYVRSRPDTGPLNSWEWREK